MMVKRRRQCKKSKFSKFWLFWCGGGLKCPKNRNFRNFGFFGEKHRSAHQKIGIFEFSGFLVNSARSGHQKIGIFEIWGFLVKNTSILGHLASQSSSSSCATASIFAATAGSCPCANPTPGSPKRLCHFDSQ